MDSDNRKSWRTLLVAGALGLVTVALGVGVSVGVEPHRPTADDLANIPGLPSFPALPSGFPTDFPTDLPTDLPTMPGLPDFPELPELPELPTIPGNAMGAS